MEHSETKKTPKYSCELCRFTTNNKNDFTRHIGTRKHNKLVGNETNETYFTQKTQNIKHLCHMCNVELNSRTSLWRHTKKCNNEIKEEEPNYKELLLMTLKQNKEMQEFMLKQNETINEMIPKIGSTTNTINSNNSFNLNFFLNEQCKNAITMDEFMNKIEVSLSNLFYTKEKGIAEGLSNIFIENMNKLPITQRPIHCTDVKRETIYIKNEKWEKDEDQAQTKEVIKKLSNIQIKNLIKYKQEYPDCMKIDKQKDTYMELIKATTDDVDDKEGKIIKNVCKNVYIKNNKDNQIE